MASPPAALTEANAQQFRLKMFSLKARKSVNHSHIDVNKDRTASLGPWPESLPESYIKHYQQEVRRPTLTSRESAAGKVPPSSPSGKNITKPCEWVPGLHPVTKK